MRAQSFRSSRLGWGAVFTRHDVSQRREAAPPEGIAGNRMYNMAISQHSPLNHAIRAADATHER